LPWTRNFYTATIGKRAVTQHGDDCRKVRIRKNTFSDKDIAIVIKCLKSCKLVPTDAQTARLALKIVSASIIAFVVCWLQINCA
jgi:hypothetical protein